MVLGSPFRKILEECDGVVIVLVQNKIDLMDQVWVQAGDQCTGAEGARVRRHPDTIGKYRDSLPFSFWRNPPSALPSSGTAMTALSLCPHSPKTSARALNTARKTTACNGLPQAAPEAWHDGPE